MPIQTCIAPSSVQPMFSRLFRIHSTISLPHAIDLYAPPALSTSSRLLGRLEPFPPTISESSDERGDQLEDPFELGSGPLAALLAPRASCTSLGKPMRTRLYESIV